MHERWEALCRRIACPDLTRRYEALHSRYTERHRAYHTWTHITECLDVWQQCPDVAENPAELELAVWLHDAIYRPLGSDNEERSAELAVDWLGSCPVAGVSPQRVRGLILATRHPAVPESSDEALIQDIDLHILGASEARFDEFEKQVRHEYRVVPWTVFRRRRAELLRAFLASEHLFHTAWFRERFEAGARRNLAGAVERLSGGAV